MLHPATTPPTIEALRLFRRKVNCARAEHVCVECREHIRRGEPYEEIQGSVPGSSSLVFYRTCARCFWDWARVGGDRYLGQLNRILADEGLAPSPATYRRPDEFWSEDGRRRAKLLVLAEIYPDAKAPTLARVTGYTDAGVRFILRQRGLMRYIDERKGRRRA